MKKNIANTIILFGFGLIVCLYIFSKKHSLEENDRYEDGVIVGPYKGVKGSKYVMYQFEVNGREYTGLLNRDQCNDCDCCQEGNSIIVKYDETDPENNTFYKVYER